MIAHARHMRPHPRIKYETGDMRAITSGPWDLAVCLGNSLSLLTSESDLHATFCGAYAHLSPGGVFVAQILNYAQPGMAEARLRIEHAAEGGRPATGVKTLVPHEEHTYLTLSYFVLGGEGASSHSETAILRNWTRGHLDAAAQAAGFHVEAVYGAYDKSPFKAESSTDVIYVCVKYTDNICSL